jgi:maleylacetate reductase
MNAIAHAVEALYARDRNPLISLAAEEGIEALARALPRISEDPRDRESRSDALYGAWLCGVCLGTVGMALHHKLRHALGGSFGLPHAETHAIVLPHAAAYNALAAPAAMARVARALGTTMPREASTASQAGLG